MRSLAVFAALTAFSCVPVEPRPAHYQPRAPTGTPLNRAGPFTIGIAALAGDASGELRKLVAKELLAENAELAIRPVTASALPPEVGPGESVDTNQRLRHALVDLRVDALVWGSALGAQGASVPRLFVAAAPRERQSPALPGGDFGRPPSVHHWALPAQAWVDVEPLLAAVLLAEAVRYDPGRYPPRAVAPLFRRVEALIRAPALGPSGAGGWSGESRWRARAAYADALGIVGSLLRDSTFLYSSVEVWKQAIEDAPRELAPLPWAAANDGWGLALVELGRRTSINNQRFEDAASAFRAALDARDRQTVPLEWAATQRNLGLALRIHGAREVSTARLEAAVSALQQALEAATRKRDPLVWAETQRELGFALASLGELEPAPTHSLAAVAALRAALEVFAPDETPVDWARTQSILGQALTFAGKREEGREHLVEAVTALNRALEVQRRELAPLPWALTQSQLGVALGTLGEREEGLGHVLQAVAAFRSALEELTPEREPFDWALTQRNLGVALRVLATKREKPACEAIIAHLNALKVLHGAAPLREVLLVQLRLDLESIPTPTAALCPSVPRFAWSLPD